MKFNIFMTRIYLHCSKKILNKLMLLFCIDALNWLHNKYMLSINQKSWNGFY